MLLGTAIGAVALYLIGLFWLAARQDRQVNSGLTTRHQRWIYGLSLGVYCTSWTFFGGVGTAATTGLDYLPIYLGPILVFTLGFGFVRRILVQAKAQHSTSIADFLSARYGKSASVAALVTLMATLGSLPYMALQLQSVGASLIALDPDLETGFALDEIVLLVAGAMALFAILFGSRRIGGDGDNPGLVLTIAVESIVKLVALLAVAGLAIYLLSTTTNAPSPQNNTPLFSIGQLDARFGVLTIIAACAALCLPRQFHMTFVEAGDDTVTPETRWIFPAYLLLIAIVIVPIAMAGAAMLPATGNADMIVMALPLSTGNDTLALLVFIGGFSASTGMIMVASVTLSTMITNDLISPILFRRELQGHADRSGLGERLLLIRRAVIGVLLALAYIFYLGFGAVTNLAGLGTLAFAAVAQFAPGLIFGVISRTGNRAGMLCGLATGFLGWLTLLIWPSATGAAPLISIHPDLLVSGVIISLGTNIAAYWTVSALTRSTLLDSAQAAAFVGQTDIAARQNFVTQKRVADIRLLLEQFVGKRRAIAAIADMPMQYRDVDPADDSVMKMAERMISSVTGASSARMLIASWSGGAPVPLPDVVAMFDETSRRLSFSGDLLQIAIENIDQGVALVDSDMNLVAWNTRYQELFALPDHLVTVGTPIADLIRFNLKRGDVAADAVEEQVNRRLDYMRAGREHRIEREQYDGRFMRIIGNPAPGGGYVTSYTDITEDRRAEQILEHKVMERTQQLSAANNALETATRSKTRFLAAASHDLIQPLNAARLFASALGEEVAGNDKTERLVRNLDGSIESADRLIRALLDISKLDGGGVTPKLENIAIHDLLHDMKQEFSLQAKAKNIDLAVAPSSAWVRSDRALLGSILRNFVSNAIRYTKTGTILIGVRRRGTSSIKISVYDTGLGIAAAEHERIFEEFQRATDNHDGLGLGLAIVRRAARLLDLPITVSSVPNQGSHFAVTIPVLKWARQQKKAQRAVTQSALANAHVLVVDNDPAALSATTALLKRWGLSVASAESETSAKSACPVMPDVAIMDYQLNDGETGDAAFAALCEFWGRAPPVILLTAEDSDITQAAAVRMGGNRLLKPSAPAPLRALITDAVSRSRRLRHHTGTESASG